MLCGYAARKVATNANKEVAAARAAEEAASMKVAAVSEAAPAENSAENESAAVADKPTGGKPVENEEAAQAVAAKTVRAKAVTEAATDIQSVLRGCRFQFLLKSDDSNLRAYDRMYEALVRAHW